MKSSPAGKCLRKGLISEYIKMQQANGQVTWPKRNHLINTLYSGNPLNDTFANSENPYEMP